MLRNVSLMTALAIFCVLASDHSVRPVRAAKEERAAGKGHYVHVVIITLKKDAPDGEAKALIQDAQQSLSKIPSVRELRAGGPAAVMPKLARMDYQVGVVIFFDDADGLTTWLEHPILKQYVEKHGKHLDMDKLRVYDFVDKR